MPVTITAVIDPCNASRNRISSVDWIGGQRLDGYVNDRLPAVAGVRYVVAVNGHVIKGPLSEVVIRDGDMIAVGARIEITSMAAAVGTWLAGALFPASLGIMGSVVGYAMAYAVGYVGPLFVAGIGLSKLVGLLSPSVPTTASAASSYDQAEQTYSWGELGQTTTEGTPIMDIYGANRVSGQVLDQYVDIQDNKEILYVLLGICGRQVDSITDIRINNQPYTYFRGVTAETRLGTLNDEPIAGFAEVHGQSEVNAKMMSGSPLTRTTDGDAVEKLRFVVTAPSGIYYANSQAGLDSRSVTFTLEYKKHAAGSWTLFDTITLTGATTEAIRKIYTIDNLDPDQYDMRLTRTTADSTDYRTRTDIYWMYWDEIIKESYIYPGIAKYAIKALASEDISGSKPAFTCLATVSTVQVFDTSLSTPAWVARSAENLAWICYDRLSRGGVDKDLLIYDEFKEFADYNDEDVSAPLDPEEKRNVASMVFSSGNLWDNVQKAARIGQAAVIYRGSDFGVFVDKAETVVSHVFNMGNILDETFEMNYLEEENRANCVEIEYTDPDRDYTRQPISVHSQEYLSSTSIAKTVQLPIEASIPQKQGIRAGVRLINSNKYFLRAPAFDAFIDSFGCVVGDLCYFQHEVVNYDGNNLGGRIIGAGNDYNVDVLELDPDPENEIPWVQLDRKVTVETGVSHKVFVRLGDDSHVEKTVSGALDGYTANHCLNSEDMNTWTKDGITVVSNTAQAPDGTMTADKVVPVETIVLVTNNLTTAPQKLRVTATPMTILETVDNNTHYIRWTGIVSVGKKYEISCEVSSIGGRNILIGFNQASYVYAIFDLSNGTIMSTGLLTEAEISETSPGVYLCKVRGVATTTGLYVDYMCASGTSVSYAGDITKGLTITNVLVRECQRISQSITTTPKANVNASVFAKPDEYGALVRLSAWNSTQGFIFDIVANLIAGTIISGATGAIDPAENGYYRISATGLCVSGTATYMLYPAGGSPQADGVSGMLAWGFQITEGAVSVADGPELVVNPNDLTAAGWSGGMTVTPNTARATAAYQTRVQNIPTEAGEFYEFSFFARVEAGAQGTGIVMYHYYSVPYNNSAITLTSTLTKYTTVVLGRAGGGLVVFGIQDANSSAWVTITCQDFSVRKIAVIPAPLLDYVKTGSNPASIADTLSLASPWISMPVRYDLYNFGLVTSGYLKKYRIVDIGVRDDFTASLVLGEYIHDIYTDNSDYVIEEPAWENQVQEAVHVSASEFLSYAADGSYKSNINVSWHRAYSDNQASWNVWLQDITQGGAPVHLAYVHSLQYTITAPLLVGHQYRIIIAAGDKGPVLFTGNTTTITIQGKLAPPANVINFTGVWDSIHRAVHFNWTAVSDIDLLHYEIREGGSWATGVVVKTSIETGTTIYIDEGVAETKTYRIKAKDKSKIYSAAEATVAVPIDTSDCPLSVPGDLSLSSASVIANDGRNVVTLLATWNADAESSDNWHHYEIMLEDTATERTSFFSTTVREFQWELLPNKEYGVTVRAVDRSGNHTVWATEVLHTTAKDTTPPATPTWPATEFAIAGFRVIGLRWNQNTEYDLSYYILERSTESDFSADVTVLGEIGATFHADSNGLEVNTEYFYRLKAVDTSGNPSEYSLIKSATTLQVGSTDIAADAIIADHIHVTNLAAISAILGTITSGKLQNSAGTTYFDLDNNRLKLGDVFDFNNGTLTLTGGGGISYTSTPSPPYSVGQLWQDGSTVKRCITAKAAGGSYSAADWVVSSTNDVDIRHGSDVTKIDGGKIYTGTITANAIAAGAITAVKVGTNQIVASSANLANAVVGEAQIGTAAVTNAKIGTAAVQSANIADANVTNIKVSGTAYLNGTKLSIAASGSFYIPAPSGGGQYMTFTITHNLGRLAIVQLYSDSWGAQLDNIMNEDPEILTSKSARVDNAGNNSFQIYVQKDIAARYIHYVYM